MTVRTAEEQDDDAAARAMRTLRDRPREVLRDLVARRSIVPAGFREEYHQAAYDVWLDYLHHAENDFWDEGAESSVAEAAAYMMTDAGLTAYMRLH